ncbi:MAG: hypothetical protein P8098_16475, partial [Candidatus Thiodiazotropha sp.]
MSEVGGNTAKIVYACYQVAVSRAGSRCYSPGEGRAGLEMMVTLSAVEHSQPPKTFLNVNIWLSLIVSSEGDFLYAKNLILVGMFLLGNI